MLLILEGQRNTGKTTIINSLVERHSSGNSFLKDFKIEKLILPRKQYPIVSMMRDWMPLCFDKSKIWLMDRAQVSEQVYTEHLGRKVTWQQSEMAWAEYFLSLGDPLMFYLKCDEQTLVDRKAKTSKEYEGIISELSRLFDIYVKRTPMKNVTIDVSSRSVEDISIMIEDYASRFFAQYMEIP